MAKPPQPRPYFSYTPSSLTEAAEQLISASSEVWDQVTLISPEQATFNNAIQPIIDDEDARATKSRILSFLSSASPSKEVRDASKNASIALSRDNIQRYTREDVFAVVTAVSKRPEVASLPSESQLYLEKLTADFVDNGLALQKQEDRARLKAVKLRLSELGTQYITNLNADVSGLWLTIDELDGVPSTTTERFKLQDGQYWVSFKRPDMQAVMNYAISARVRRKYYVAWDNRLKDSNGPLLNEILQLRRESARLLGYENYFESRDEDRMLSTKEARRFLSSIRDALTELGRAELKDLAELKMDHLQSVPTQQKDESSIKAMFRWDAAYYKRLMKDKESEIDSEKVAEYYSFQLVLPKLVEMFSLLFGLRLVELPRETEGLSTWHEDVMSFELWDNEDQGGGFLGYLYVDPYPRDGKYGHMGHFGLVPGFTTTTGERSHPVSALMLNYPPPTPTRPSLLKYKEVVSCFHELGHAIHWLVSRTKHSRFHGTLVARDFVEVPSRLLEHFFWDRNVIRAMSCHFEKPELDIKVPEGLIDDLIATRYENVASGQLGNLLFSNFDMAVHTTWDATKDNQTELSVMFNKMRREISLLRGPEDLGRGYGTLHGQTHFRHICGYASSYYAYLVADSFSTDMFNAKFRPLLSSDTCRELKDIVNDELRAEAKRYRHTVLQPGSSTGSEMNLIRAFLGREPNPRAYVEVLAEAASTRRSKKIRT